MAVSRLHGVLIVAYDFDFLFDDQPSGDGYASSWDFDYLFDEEDEGVNLDHLFDDQSWEPQPMPVEQEVQPEQPESPSTMAEFGKALVSGGIEIGKSPNTLLKMLGNQMQGGWLEKKLGLDKAGKALSEYAGGNIETLERMEKPFEQAEELKNKNVWDDPDLLTEPLWWARGVGQLIPSLAAAIIPAAQAGKAVESAAVAANAAPHVVKNLASLGAQLTGGAVGAGLESTSTYEDILEETGDHSEALTAAGLFAPTVFALSAFSSGKLLEKAGKGFMAKLAKRGTAAAVEGITEGAEEPAEIASKIAAKIIEGKPIPEDVQGMFMQSFKDALTVMPLAAVTGGGIATLSGDTIDADYQGEPIPEQVANPVNTITQKVSHLPRKKQYTELKKIESELLEEGYTEKEFGDALSTVAFNPAMEGPKAEIEETDTKLEGMKKRTPIEKAKAKVVRDTEKLTDEPIIEESTEVKTTPLEVQQETPELIVEDEPIQNVVPEDTPVPEPVKAEEEPIQETPLEPTKEEVDDIQTLPESGEAVSAEAVETGEGETEQAVTPEINRSGGTVENITPEPSPEGEIAPTIDEKGKEGIGVASKEVGDPGASDVGGDIFIKPKLKSDKGGTVRSRILSKLQKSAPEGREAVYKPYGEQGKGYYYVQKDQAKAPPTPKRPDTGKEPPKSSGLSPKASLQNTLPDRFEGYAWRSMTAATFKKLKNGLIKFGGSKPKAGKKVAPFPENATQYAKDGHYLVEFSGAGKTEGETSENQIGKDNITRIWRFDGKDNEWYDVGVTLNEEISFQKKRDEKLRQRAVRGAKNIRQWVVAMGGVKRKDADREGEWNDIFGKGKIGAKGYPYGFFNNKTGQGVDILHLAAIDHGWLGPEATEEDFMSAITGNLSEKFVMAGSSESVDAAYEKEYERLLEEEQRREEEARDVGADKESIESAKRSGEEEGVSRADEDFADQEGFKLTPPEWTDHEKVALAKQKGEVETPKKGKSKAVFNVDEKIERKGDVGEQKDLFDDGKQKNKNLFDDDLSDIPFSKSTTKKPKGLPLKTVENVVNKFAPAFKGFERKIYTYKSPRDLTPDKLKAFDINPSTDIIRGLYDPKSGDIHMFADGMNSKADAVSSLLEEMFHSGIHRVVPKETLTGIYNDAKDTKEMAWLVENYRIDPKTDKGKVALADEWLAKSIKTDSLPAQVWQKIVTAVRRFLRGIGIDVKYTTNEIKQLVRRSVISGENVSDVGNKPPDIRKMVAYHGTPHTLAPEKGFPNGRFRLDKVGTGEGGAAYGWGIYLAEKEDTAKGYQVERVKVNEKQYANIGLELGGTEQSAVKSLKENGYNKDKAIEKLEKEKNYSAALWLRDNDVQVESSLYELDIPDNVIPKLLDWDAPLSEQSEYVKKALKPYLLKRMSEKDYNNFFRNNGQLYKEETTPLRWTGKTLYNVLSRDIAGNAGAVPQWAREQNGQKAASEYLASIGIPGNTHGGMSKGGTGAKYVIWDQAVLDRIALLKRNQKELKSIQKEQPAEWVRKDLSPTTDKTVDNERKSVKNNSMSEKGTGEIPTKNAEGSPFKDSVVQDVVYHGTMSTFEEFDPKKSRYELDEIYFTSSQDEAKKLAVEFPSAKSGKLNIKKAYISIKNPFIDDQKGKVFDIEEMLEIIEVAQHKKHDGAIIQNIRNFEGGKISDTYVVFSPAQIKILPNQSRPSSKEGQVRFSKVAPATDEAAKADISKRHKVPEDSLEYLDEWSMPEINKTLYLYNVIKPGHEKHGSTLAYDPGEVRFDRAITSDKYFGREKKTLGDIFSEVKKAFKENAETRIFDRFNPIHTVGEEAYRLYRLTTGAMSTFKRFLVDGPLYMTSDGLPIVKTKGEGVLTWFKEMGTDAENLLKWIAVKRAEVLESQGREKWLDKAARKEILEEIGAPKNAKTWEELNDKFQEYNRNILDYAQSAGLIDPESRKEWEQDFYVPFYRLMENGSEEFLQAPMKSRKHISAGIKKLTGRDAKIGDLFENTLKNWSHLIQESSRNIAAASAYAGSQGVMSSMVDPKTKQTLPAIQTMSKKDLIKTLGSKTKKTFAVKKPDKKAVKVFDNKADAVDFMKGLGKGYIIDPRTETKVMMTNSAENNILSFFLDGKQVHIKINDPELFNAMTNMNALQMSGFMGKMFGTPKRVLTYAATFGPAFRVANMVRDTIHTSIISKSFVPFWDTAIGFGKALRKDQDWISFQSSGAGQGASYIHAEDPQAMAKYVKRVIKKDGTAKRILSPKQALKFLDWWDAIGAASEDAARVQLFTKRMKEEGKTRFDAAFEARDLLDFTMRGDSKIVQGLIRTLPFANARMQGLYKLGKAAKADPKSFAVKMGIMTASALALWALAQDDEDFDEHYGQLEDWEKMAYHNFWIGKYQFRIPRTFELGILPTLIEASLDSMKGTEDAYHVFKAFGKSVVDTLALNPIPQAARPIAEQWANKSFFTGRPIEGLGMQRLLPAQRKSPHTSTTLSAILDNRVADSLGISPVRAEALINGYFSTVGMLALGISDMVIQQAADYPNKPTMSLSQYPMIGRFVRNSENQQHSKYLTKLYNLTRDLGQINSTINNYKLLGDTESARRLLKDKRGELRFRKSLDRVKAKVSKINRQIKRLMASTHMTSEEKRKRINTLSQRKLDIVGKAVQRVQI